MENPHLIDWGYPYDFGNLHMAMDQFFFDPDDDNHVIFEVFLGHLDS